MDERDYIALNKELTDNNTMKHYKYIGFFERGNRNETVYCDSFFQAFILLTANAIEKGENYQLSRITKEDGEKILIKDISYIQNLFIQTN